MKIPVILVAGGVGRRMSGPIPKQYLELGGKPIVLHSFEYFIASPLVSEVVVVCDLEYRHLFFASTIKVSFADPGKERHNSVYNGISALSSQEGLVCTHDSVRPFIKSIDMEALFKQAVQHQGAASAVPVKNTIKQIDSNHFALMTIDRSHLWEMHTPQIIPIDKWLKGYGIAYKNNISVTDDLQIMELAGYPTKLIYGSYSNIKITTPEDLIFAQTLLSNL